MPDNADKLAQLQDEAQALFCAMNVMEGTAGGFTPEEKMAAKMKIQEMYRAKIEEWKQEAANESDTNPA